MSNDLVNGLFEFMSAIALVFHCRRLYIDKKVRGVSFLPFVFYSAWGYWNLFFYPSLDQWWSFCGGIGVVSVNTFYCVLMWRYRKN